MRKAREGLMTWTLGVWIGKGVSTDARAREED